VAATLWHRRSRATRDLTLRALRTTVAGADPLEMVPLPPADLAAVRTRVLRQASLMFVIVGVLGASVALFSPGWAADGTSTLWIAAVSVAYGLALMLARGRIEIEHGPLVATTSIWLLTSGLLHALQPGIVVWGLPLLVIPALGPAMYLRSRQLRWIVAHQIVASVIVFSRADASVDGIGSARATGVVAFALVVVALAISTYRLAEARRTMFEFVRAIAETDSLTGLANRRAWVERTEALVRAGVPASVVIADVDHFKRINDEHGHDAGDRHLLDVAGALKQACRADDLVGRLGGEEFVLTLPGASADQALAVTEAVRRALADRLTLSFGIAEVLADDDVSSVLHRADGALYEAKRTGRDRAVVAGRSAQSSAAI
jgi:diguanylate cyclase (GGDEF)-like protein